MVGTDTVLGPGADAAVLRIKGRPDGIAVAIDAQPRVAAIDPFAGAALAVAEATRNLVCVGATPLAITDCLNLGNPERPRGAYELERTIDGIRAACEALGVPVVSGNVSLYNASVSLGASAYGAAHGLHEGPVSLDLALEARLQRFVLAAHAAGALRAAHDRSDGGLGVALAELAIRDGVGMKVTLPAVRGLDKRVTLFGEGPP